MNNTKERNPQLKTLEQMITAELKNGSDNEHTRSSYEYMCNHFADEDFLHGCKHKDLITEIYLHDFYKTHNVSALQLKFHLDPKTLLEARKGYLRLFSKHYLSLDTCDENYRVLLYHALKKD